MSECESCGREDGHYTGCAEVPAAQASGHDLRYGGHASDEQCAYGDCENPKRPKGKGPAPKYCEEHSDPKNRK